MKNNSCISYVQNIMQRFRMPAYQLHIIFGSNAHCQFSVHLILTWPFKLEVTSMNTFLLGLVVRRVHEMAIMWASHCEITKLKFQFFEFWIHEQVIERYHLFSVQRNSHHFLIGTACTRPPSKLCVWLLNDIVLCKLFYFFIINLLV
jgi:hypothetical protein